MNRRSFFQSVAKTVAIVALAPQLAFRVKPLAIRLPEIAPVELTPIGQGHFDRYIFPVIANMCPSANIADLVQVQPMSLPSGAVFYMDFAKRPSFWDRLRRLLHT